MIEKAVKETPNDKATAALKKKANKMIEQRNKQEPAMLKEVEDLYSKSESNSKIRPVKEKSTPNFTDVLSGGNS